MSTFQQRLARSRCLQYVSSFIHLQNGWTPLIRASNEGNLKLVKVITDLGTNVNHQTEVPCHVCVISVNHGVY